MQNSQKKKIIPVENFVLIDEICDIGAEIDVAKGLASVLKGGLSSDEFRKKDLWAVAETLEERLLDVKQRLNDLEYKV